MPQKVTFIRPEVENMLDTWKRIRAAVDGQEAVKKLGDAVLCRPDPTDVSTANQARYNSYLARAVWYPVTGRTLDGLTGFAFAKPPTVTLPATITTLETNVNGGGLTLIQQAQESLRLALSLGRGGLLVDYPVTSGPTTKSDLLQGNISPVILLYEADAITNWRLSQVGSQTLLDLLVLKETFAKEITDENDFDVAGLTQYRVLRRTAEGVTGEIWRQNNGEGEFLKRDDLGYIPKDKNGKALTEIPFTPIGAENNDFTIDSPPLLDLVNLNIAHFANSADYEESCFICGQPTPVVAGVTQAWVDNVFKGELRLGSRTVIPLPEGGSAMMLQAAPNSMPKEAMEHKELQMVKIGAKLIEDQKVQQTATEASIDQTAEVSTLTTAVNNVFQAYERAFKFCALFVGSADSKLVFELSEPLTQEPIDAQMATAIMALFVGQLIDFEEARKKLKRTGIAWKDDAEVKANNDAQGFQDRSVPVDNLPPA